MSSGVGQMINKGSEFSVKNKIFNTEEFVGIAFYHALGEKYSVFALHISLKRGPEFLINDETDELTVKLRNIIIDYLKSHEELNLSIEDFM